MTSPRLDSSDSYRTAGGVAVRRSAEPTTYDRAIEPLIDALDGRRGVLLASSFEYPGRYTRWDVGFADPPLAIAARDRDVRVTALNERGVVLLPAGLYRSELTSTPSDRFRIGFGRLFAPNGIRHAQQNFLALCQS